MPLTPRTALGKRQTPPGDRPLLLDGGLATELEQRGCDLGGRLWSANALLNSPAQIEKLHFDYLMAGAECIVTASYQVSFEGFAEEGWSRADTIAALKNSVTIADTARARYRHVNDAARWIAASVGPYGAILHNGAEFHGNYSCSHRELVSFHRSRLDILATTNADLLAYETIPSLDEALALVEAMRPFPDVAGWVSFTCADGKHTAHGESLSSCAKMLDREPQVLAIGVNCTAPHLISSLIQEIRLSTTKPIVVYPNSGEMWDAANRRWEGRPEPSKFGALAKEWMHIGAQWIGGCCRTGPAHIREIGDVMWGTRR